MTQAARCISEGRAVLGLELGSTRIKAVLIDEGMNPIASGAFDWENRLEEGVWTYRLEDALSGVRAAYASLRADALARHGVAVTRLAAAGISAMMHGYLAFDGEDRLLVPFRTWRNTMTEQAASELTALFGVNIPQRWSIAHLHQAILNGEEHIARLHHLNTLAGWVHEQLTGQRVLGVGDASGMFPMDGLGYDSGMIEKYDAWLAARGLPLSTRALLPVPLCAGEEAGVLTEAGARLLDPSGDLTPGVPFAPPEGDAGTGMAATNSVSPRTGNVSAGTSVFAMVVLEKPLSRVYPELDLVSTPDGQNVAMAHVNNCTSDINAWAGMLGGFAQALGIHADAGSIYGALFQAAMRGKPDCGGVVNVNCLSGEPVLGLPEGRPMLLRTPDASLSFENFARALVLGAMAGLSRGMDILSGEGVRIDRLTGHGGFFKTPGTAQQLMASALSVPVSALSTAGEGGPWGMALLAAYRVRREAGESLPHFLAEKVFCNAQATVCAPDPEERAGFEAYMRRLEACLPAERAACAVK